MSLREARGQQGQLAEVIDAALNELDLDQEVKFQAYSRVVLPIDGYIFWKPTVSLTVKGSLHFMQDIAQEETETVGNASITFTTRDRVVEFSEAPINTIYVGCAGHFRFAFSSQQGYFSAAKFWHYQGHRIAPVMERQLLDDPTTIDPSRAIVSNSLPLWLAMNGYTSPFLDGFSNQVMLYPSFVVPPNLTPPYCAVHIPPEATRAVQSVPMIMQGTALVNGKPVNTRQHTQLCEDTVHLTVYGLQNLEALNFFDMVLEVLRDGGQMGLTNTPVTVDRKRTLPELQAIAMQKSWEFKVSYNMYAVSEMTMQLIKQATAAFYSAQG